MKIVSRTFLDRWEPPIKKEVKNEQNKFLKFKKIQKVSTTIKSGSGGEIYTVFDEESDSEVRSETLKSFTQTSKSRKTAQKR